MRCSRRSAGWGVILGVKGYTSGVPRRLAPPPIASYRIQLTPSFGFADTIGILDHLVALGVSHVYLSPVAEAVPGSLHGYDVIDHTRVRSDFGGDGGLMALLAAAHDRGLGVVIDHVPNHMSVAEAHLNDRWWEMLRDGPDASAASWFDVDWDATDGKVIVPKLGDPLDELLASGGLSIGEGDRGPELRYGPLRFPLAPGTEQLGCRGCGRSSALPAAVVAGPRPQCPAVLHDRRPRRRARRGARRRRGDRHDPCSPRGPSGLRRGPRRPRRRPRAARGLPGGPPPSHR